jgi:hypothetical protein
MNLSFVRSDSIFPNINEFTCHNQNCELPSDQCPINIAIQANQTASVCVYVEVLSKSVNLTSDINKVQMRDLRVSP